MASLASRTAQGTLPWSWYSDPELLRREQERIFRHGWQYAGPAEHAARAGRLLHVRVADVPVVVTRDRDGELHALLNVCRHRGSLVASGRGNRADAAVPLPRVDLRARRPAALRTARPGARARRASACASWRSRRGARCCSSTRTPSRRRSPRRSARCRSSSPRAESSSSSSASAGGASSSSPATGRSPSRTTSSATTARSRIPGFSQVVDVSPDAYRLETHALGSSQFGPSRNGGGAVEGQFHWLWPATKVYALPGPPNLAAGPVAPLGPERTAGFLDYFFPEDVSDAEVDELLAFDDQVGLEDRALVESVQAGVRSGLLDEGRLLPESERLLAHFQSLVREALA